ncbi:GM19432 [Drosophila sechellia]|uniref:GM19432 n=1 Tax=Drosophila sechellia TaxID=7238 RepID=B4IDD6_DROSE|nr:GM19432 [Drosophila sechellia]
MFGLRTSFLCPVVAFCILLGVSSSTSHSACVLSDAPNQCGAFCMYDHCMISTPNPGNRRAVC